MWVKNFTDKDLTLEKKGLKVVLTANTSTLIPDNLVTGDELNIMFGKGKVAVDESGASTSLYIHQQVVEVGKLYQTDPITGTDDIRLYVNEGAEIDVYGSDSDTIPTSFSEMNCPSENEGATGCLRFALTPKFLGFKTSSGTPHIIITNCNLIEIGNLS